MRVLFTSIEGSHIHLLVPLAWALRTAGHDVRVACKPTVTDRVTQAGLTAVPVDCPDWQSVLTPFHLEALAWCNEVETGQFERGQPTWETLLAYENVVVPALWAPLNHDSMVDGLVAYARYWRPDLVVWETFCMAGPIAAVACGAAHARLVSGPDLALQMRPRRAFVAGARALPAEAREDPTAEWFEWSLERNGCAATFDESMLTGQWTVDTRPESARDDPGVPSVPMRYVPYNGRSVVPQWLREPPARPRVCLTLGVTISGDYAMFDLDRVLAEVLLTLAELDVEVVAAIAPQQREHLPTLPGNVRIVDFVPIDDLLPGCALVVHHGGYQTKATAQWHGVPQVIVTGWEWVSEGMGEDYEKQGDLLALPLRLFSPETFRQAVTRVLTEPSYGDNARRLRDEMRAMPPPNDVVSALEGLTRRHRLDRPEGGRNADPKGAS